MSNETHDTKAAKRRMLADIEREVAFTRYAIGKDAFAEQVMKAMQSVPRERFVPPALQAAAFDNGPLPIGHGQTISQPYIVALMTDMLQLEPHHVVLEIGTGCGYQTAVLATLCHYVYSVELVQELADAASWRLTELGYRNVETRIGDGHGGWPEHAPYDGIIVTAAASHIPGCLLEQLKAGGRLVIPVGPPYSQQRLLLVEKDQHGDTHMRELLGVAFVPLRETGNAASATPVAH